MSVIFVLMKEVSEHINQIKQLCDHIGVESLFVFGSAASDTLSPDSDIDFLVEFADKDPLMYSDKYFMLKTGLEGFFNRNIDLLEARALSNRFLKSSIDQSKVLIYGRPNKNLAS